MMWKQINVLNDVIKMCVNDVIKSFRLLLITYSYQLHWLCHLLPDASSGLSPAIKICKKIELHNYLRRWSVAEPFQKITIVGGKKQHNLGLKGQQSVCKLPSNLACWRFLSAVKGVSSSSFWWLRKSAPMIHSAARYTLVILPWND